MDYAIALHRASFGKAVLNIQIYKFTNCVFLDALDVFSSFSTAERMEH